MKCLCVEYVDLNYLSELKELKWLEITEGHIRNAERVSDLQIYGNRSERVKEQAEIFFNHVENVTVTEEIPNMLAL